MQTSSESNTETGENKFLKPIKFSNHEKHVLFIIRIIFGIVFSEWILGFITYVAGEWLYSTNRLEYFIHISKPCWGIINTVIVSGGITFIAGVLACWAAFHHDHKILCMFTYVIYFTSVIEISLGITITAYVGKTAILTQSEILYELKNITSERGAHLSESEYFELQEKVGCCGVVGPYDWLDSTWWNEERANNSDIVLPRSCCKQEVVSEGCSSGDPPYRVVRNIQNIYSTGCIYILQERRDPILLSGGMIIFLVGAVKLISLFVLQYAITLVIRNEYEMERKKAF